MATKRKSKSTLKRNEQREVAQGVKPCRLGAPDKFNAIKRAQFIELRKTGMGVTAAARRCGVTAATVYLRCRADDVFRREFDAAKEIVGDHVEERLFDVAMGDVRKGNVTALFGWLRANRPHKFRENVKIEHSGQIGVSSAEALEQARASPDLIEELRKEAMH